MKKPYGVYLSDADYSDFLAGKLKEGDVINLGISPSFHPKCSITEVDKKSKTYSVSSTEGHNYSIGWDIEKHNKDLERNGYGSWAFYSVKRK